MKEGEGEGNRRQRYVDMWLWLSAIIRLPDNDNRHQQKTTSTSYRRLWSSLIYYYHFSNVLKIFLCVCFCVCKVKKAGKHRNIVQAGWCASWGSRVRLMKQTICFQFTFDCTNIVKNGEMDIRGKIYWKALSMCWGSMWNVSIGSWAPTMSFKVPSKDPNDDYKRMIRPEHETVLKVASSRAD